MKNNDLTYIGFGVKAGKIIYGIDLIKNSKKQIYIILLCRFASENTKKAAINYAKHSNIDIIMTKEMLLEEIVNKVNCKTAALTDKNLADALKKNCPNFVAVMEDFSI